MTPTLETSRLGVAADSAQAATIRARTAVDSFRRGRLPREQAQAAAHAARIAVNKLVVELARG